MFQVSCPELACLLRNSYGDLHGSRFVKYSSECKILLLVSQICDTTSTTHK